MIIHQFDALDDPDPNGAPWLLGVGRPDTGDRISANMVNAHMQPEPPPNDGRIPLYSLSLSGLVLSPKHNRLWCSYPFDSGTLERVCWPRGWSEDCTPGCTDPKHWKNTLWCEKDRHDWPCAWHPADLKYMLDQREEIRAKEVKPFGKFWDDNKFYNELVFDAAHFTEQLPASIEGLFFLAGGDCSDITDGPKCEDYARGAHENMKRHFGLTDEQFPLLRLDPNDWDTPFTIDSPPAKLPGGLELAGLGGSCASHWCSTFESLLSDTNAKFWMMWGGAYQRKFPHTQGCWDWQGGGADDFFQGALTGRGCNRNWLENAMGGYWDRPFESPSPALLGFDESIVEVCSRLIGVDPWKDNEDLNNKLAFRCHLAQRNVLRLMTGGWTMCQNLEWQMCALQGKLPGQGSDTISFATPPRDLQLEWWNDPTTHPTYPCDVWARTCDPNAFTVGDVYFAEVMITYTICENRARLFDLDVDERFQCNVDVEAYRNLATRLRNS